MTKEELFFKENYPEYVTEKGECLSPYWDLFSAGVICATFELNNEIAELKDKLKNLESVAKVRLANWQKYSKELKEAKELIRQLCSMVRELNKPNVQLTNVDYSLAEAEDFFEGE